MLILRRAAGALLWVLAVVGLASAGVWIAASLGAMKPLIVISGSMEPEINTGDLLIATRVSASELQVGQVASLQNRLSESLVTHRITAITSQSDGTLRIAMQGDANDFGDALDYILLASDSVWVPQHTVPGAGAIVSRMTTPAVAVPLLIGVLSLVGITWLIPVPPRRRVATEPQADDEDAGADQPDLEPAGVPQ